jgi:alpha-glucosidase
VSREEGRVILRLDLSPEEIIFGLGESVRGINKRGRTYRSWNMDITNHTED